MLRGFGDALSSLSPFASLASSGGGGFTSYAAATLAADSGSGLVLVPAGGVGVEDSVAVRGALRIVGAAFVDFGGWPSALLASGAGDGFTSCAVATSAAGVGAGITLADAGGVDGPMGGDCLRGARSGRSGIVGRAVSGARAATAGGASSSSATSASPPLNESGMPTAGANPTGTSTMRPSGARTPPAPKSSSISPGGSSGGASNAAVESPAARDAPPGPMHERPLDPCVPVGIARRRGGRVDPGHAGAAAVEIEAMDEPVAATVRLCRRARGEDLALAPADDFVGAIVRRLQLHASPVGAAIERHADALGCLSSAAQDGADNDEIEGPSTK
jgi:hypothetical protein